MICDEFLNDIQVVTFQICGFLWGWYKQQFHLTVLILLAGFALSCIVSNGIYYFQAINSFGAKIFLVSKYFLAYTQ